VVNSLLSSMILYLYKFIKKSLVDKLPVKYDLFHYLRLCFDI